MPSAAQLSVAEPVSPPDRSSRAVPHSVEVEQALLGAILINNGAFDHVADFLESAHFYERLHGEIYEILLTRLRQGQSVTPAIVTTFLRTRPIVGDLDVERYVNALAGEAVTIINAHDYGRMIYDLATRRGLIEVGSSVVNLAYDSPVDVSPQEQVEDAEKKLYELAEQGRYGAGFHGFAAVMRRAIDMAGRAHARDGKLSGLATGFLDLDHHLGGLQASDLLIIAGRPGMGKTALATNIAFNVAREHRQADSEGGTGEGGTVGFFSLEMSAEQLATRIIADQAGISSGSIRRGRISEEQFSALVDVASRLGDLPFYIDETGGLTVAQLAARARRMKRQRGLDLMVVDYLQLAQGSSRRAMEGRVQEVSEITTSLKALAKELDIPILALSQLSRQVENRENKRPQLADLRESGSIEQDADVVMFVYREEYYLKNQEPKPNTEEHALWQSEMARVHNDAELIIGKHRHGPTGTVKLYFDGEFTRFGNAARDDHLPEH